MGRRAAALLLVTVGLSSSATAASDPRQARARDVRNAIPAAEAWYADHGTYAGMTVAKLRRAYDRSLKNVAVKRATKKGYCIQSTLRPFVHYDGPVGPMRQNACGARGPEVPRPGPTPSPAPSTAEQRLRAATPAIEAWAADHGGYAGMTIEGIRRWEASIEGITIVWTTRDRYCIESGSGAQTFHRLGPAEPVKAGPCPPRPS